MDATDEEKAEATAEVDDEFAGRQQQMETAIIQVGCCGSCCFTTGVDLLMVPLKLVTRALSRPPSPPFSLPASVT